MFYCALKFDQPIGSWNVSKVTSILNTFHKANAFNQNLGTWYLKVVKNLKGMLNYTKLSVANYDATLKGWSGNTVPGNLILDATGLKYSATGEVHRNKLINHFHWTIRGDGKK